MRLLIGFYLLFGLLGLACAALGLVVFLSTMVLHPAGRRTAPPIEELVVSALLCALVSLLLLAAAVGLWRRSQAARLILLGLCWWNFLAAPVIGVVGAAGLLGVKLADGRPLDDSPVLTLVAAFGSLAFAAWQYRVLTSPRARHEFGVCKGRHPASGEAGTGQAEGGSGP
jgi:hypothetical protein